MIKLLADLKLGIFIGALMIAMPIMPAFGFENDQPLDDPVLETRAVSLAKELRCLVCQNQSIMESDADLARDLRQVVRERVAAGESDIEIKEYVVERYGDFVLLRPPFKPQTWILWFGPALLVAGGMIGLALFWRRRAGAPAAPVPLSASERARLDRLLGDDAKT
jgi:cytochrome c-type biogenesis protein CcmH